MSARRAAVMLCALGALLWADRSSKGDEGTGGLFTAMFAAPGLEVVDVGYNAPDKAGPSDKDAAHADSGQNSGCAYGCCCQPVWRWTAGVEGTYLDTVVRGGPSVGWDAGPRIWLGVENRNGWGARARYWQIGVTDFFINQPLSDISPPTDRFDQLFHLDLYTIDAEVTKRGEAGNWDWLAFLGGRYASYANQVVTDVVQATPATSDVFLDDIHAQAGGITTGVEVSRPLGWGPLAVYGGVRVSALWGDVDNFHIARLNVSGVPSTVIIGSQGTVDLTIWEAQVGVQCSKYLACCNGTVFARCGFEYQGWDFYRNRSSISLNDLDLYGVALSVGVTR